MCMAGGVQTKTSDNRLIRTWQRFSACPFRLFTLAALMHAVVLFTLVFSASLPYRTLTTDSLLFVSLYGLLSTPVLGGLLYWMPQRFNRLQISYGWYSFIYLLILLAIMVIEIGLFFGSVVVATGAAMLAIAWYMVTLSFRDYAAWVDQGEKAWFRLMQFGLYTAVAGTLSFSIGILGTIHLLSMNITVILFATGASALVFSSVVLQRKKSLSLSSCGVSCMRPNPY